MAERDTQAELDEVIETVRRAHDALEGNPSETAAMIRHHLARALQHAPAPAPQPRELEGDFAPGTSIGDDTLRRTQALEGEQPGGAPSPSELLQENARLQERVAQLEALQNGNG